MYADRIKCTTATTGTGAVTLASTGVRDATNGDCLAPAEVPPICGKRAPYFIINGNNWCEGFGLLSSDGLTLTRDPAEWRWNGTAYSQALLSLVGTSTVIISPRGVDLGAGSFGASAALSQGVLSA